MILRNMKTTFCLVINFAVAAIYCTGVSIYGWWTCTELASCGSTAFLSIGLQSTFNIALNEEFFTRTVTM